MTNPKSAFPHVFKDADGTSYVANGLTMRDYFATRAMAVILQDLYNDEFYIGDGEAGYVFAKQCAKTAYTMADAMLEERIL